ncbi:allophanate hydrolase subunit 1 [Saxibacter everestensis]|uniref:Allophanate hydrolase subunit 1 n=1 Tax=Saxibacter everestensis TaxID=2909229 RepID=A0ABY8QXC4_9MICO|nr:allophanate hydrolase subunit 1 [Brevibacteriaceae bacterium ZFBP1038]
MTASRRILRYGEHGILVELDDLNSALGYYAALDASALPGIRQLVSGARTVLIDYDPVVVSAGSLKKQLEELESAEPDAAQASEILIPVTYAGADLDEVARHHGISTQAVVRAHTEANWTVAFTGFAPGFGYLVAEDWKLAMPRRETPRTVVPIGSVALAGEFSAVYPQDSPGGWQLIGSTAVQMFSPEAEPPALLVPGARVRFTIAQAG